MDHNKQCSRYQLICPLQRKEKGHYSGHSMFSLRVFKKSYVKISAIIFISSMLFSVVCSKGWAQSSNSGILITPYDDWNKYNNVVTLESNSSVDTATAWGLLDAGWTPKQIVEQFQSQGKTDAQILAVFSDLGMYDANKISPPQNDPNIVHTTGSNLTGWPSSQNDPNIVHTTGSNLTGWPSSQDDPNIVHTTGSNVMGSPSSQNDPNIVHTAEAYQTPDFSHADSVLIIPFYLDVPASGVQLKIYDEQGNAVKTITINANDQPMLPGNYNFKWDGVDDDGDLLATGDYSVGIQIAQDGLVFDTSAIDPDTANENINTTSPTQELRRQFTYVNEPTLNTVSGAPLDTSKKDLVILTHGRNGNTDEMTSLTSKYDPATTEVLTFEYNDNRSIEANSQDFADLVNGVLAEYSSSGETPNLILEQHSMGGAVVNNAVYKGLINTDGTGGGVIFSIAPLLSPYNIGPEGASDYMPIAQADKDANNGTTMYGNLNGTGEQTLPDGFKHYVIVTADELGTDGAINWEQQVNNNFKVDGYIQIQDRHADILNNDYLTVLQKEIMRPDTEARVEEGEYSLQGAYNVDGEFISAEAIMSDAAQAGHFGSNKTIQNGNISIEVYENGYYVKTVDGVTTQGAIGDTQGLTDDQIIAKVDASWDSSKDNSDFEIASWTDTFNAENLSRVSGNDTYRIDDNNSLLVDYGHNENGYYGGIGWQYETDDGTQVWASTGYNGGVGAQIGVGQVWQVDADDYAYARASVGAGQGGEIGYEVSAGYNGHHDMGNGWEVEYTANAYAGSSGYGYNLGVEIEHNDTFGSIDDLENGDKGFGFQAGYNTAQGAYIGLGYQRADGSKYEGEVGYNGSWTVSIQKEDDPNGKNWSATVGGVYGIQIQNGGYMVQDIYNNGSDVMASSLISADRIADHYDQKTAKFLGNEDAGKTHSESVHKPLENWMEHMGETYSKENSFGWDSWDDPEALIRTDPVIGPGLFAYDNRKQIWASAKSMVKRDMNREPVFKAINKFFGKKGGSKSDKKKRKRRMFFGF